MSLTSYFVSFFLDKMTGLHYGGDPFIPPRGRKHNLPDLDALLQRYETFVPNRGRRDKIKDIFKYDDLFYPNRGKRQSSHWSIGGGTGAGGDIKANPHHHNTIWNQELMNGENAATAARMQVHPMTNALEDLQNVVAKMKRKLHQMQRQQQWNLGNSFDEMSTSQQPTTTTRMSATFQPWSQQQQQRLEKRLKSMANILQQRHQHLSTNSNKNLNDRRQWSMVDNDRPASRSRTPATNRLHALRSMSSMLQHRQQDPPSNEYNHHRHAAPPQLWQASKFMSSSSPTTLALARQSLAQQFDPLPWHKLQKFEHQYHLPLLTMRHSRLTTSAGAVEQQSQLPHRNIDLERQQVTTPQETQLSHLDDSILPPDNTLANDLKELFNTDYD